MWKAVFSYERKAGDCVEGRFAKKQKVWYNKNNVNAGKYRKMNTGRLLLWNRNIQ
jgi:hypothetical protein